MGRVVNGRRLSRSSSDHAARKQAWKRRLQLGKRSHAFHFPTPRRRTKVYPPKSAPDSQDERTVRTAYLKPDRLQMVFHRPTDLAGQARAYLIMARRSYLHTKAGYIDADFLHPSTFPLQSNGGPYISGTGTRVSHHGQEIPSPTKAGYIDADFLHPSTFPLQSNGGPYISRTGTRVSHHGQEIPSPTKAGYIDADFLHPSTFPLQSNGGPYIAGPSELLVSFPVGEARKSRLMSALCCDRQLKISVLEKWWTSTS